jgi:hypothetical protein
MRHLSLLVLCIAVIGAPTINALPLATMQPNPQYVYYMYALLPVIDEVRFGNFDGSFTASDVNLATVQIDGLVPASTEVQPVAPGFSGQVVKASFPISQFLTPFGALYDTTAHEFKVKWQYGDGTPDSAIGNVLLIGKKSTNPAEFIIPPQVIVLPGDVDYSGDLNIGDAVGMIRIVFGGGPGPQNELIGDVDCSGSTDISDVVYLMQYIFGSGPAPCVR